MPSIPIQITSLILILAAAPVQAAYAQKSPELVTGGATLERFTILGTVQDERLGEEIAGLGDLNGDGIDDFLIGRPGWGQTGWRTRGAATVYSGSDRSILYQYAGTQDENLGTEVAGAGDLDADGTPDFLISAVENFYPSVDPGRVFAFSGATGILLHTFHGAVSDNLGRSLSALGDVNQDGHDDVLLGASGKDYGGINGSAYVYSGRDGSLLHHFTGFPSSFGFSVTGLGDVTGDGIPDLAIGAPKARRGAGTVYFFSGADFSQIKTIHGAVRNSGFGYAIGQAGDANKDGVPDLAVGAPRTDVHFNQTGSLFVISGADYSTIHRINGENRYGALGTVFDGLGDVNGDGHDDLLVGYPEHNSNPRGSFYTGEIGSAHILSGATGRALHRFKDDRSGGDDSHYGIAVANIGDINGDGLVEMLIGARDSRETLFNAGKVECFSFMPFLSIDRYEISDSLGGTVQLTIDFPDTNGGDPYHTFFSLHGQGPTTLGVPVPLLRDDMFRLGLAGQYPFPQHVGLSGILNSQGDATASFTLTPGSASQLVGRTLWVATVTGAAGGVASASSISYPILVTP